MISTNVTLPEPCVRHSSEIKLERLEVVPTKNELYHEVSMERELSVSLSVENMRDHRQDGGETETKG